MKKITFFTLILLLICFTNKAQNYSGSYTQPSNPSDIVIKTAITNFVPNTLVKIDSYVGTSSYILFTFLDDQFSPLTTIRYDAPTSTLCYYK